MEHLRKMGSLVVKHSSKKLDKDADEIDPYLNDVYGGASDKRSIIHEETSSVSET